MCGNEGEGLLTESWGLVSGCPNLLALLAFVGWGGSCTISQEGTGPERPPVAVFMPSEKHEVSPTFFTLSFDL